MKAEVRQLNILVLVETYRITHNNKMAYSNDLTERFSEFARRVLTYCSTLKLPYEFNSLKIQLIRSSTSIGANYMESQAAISKADFRNKVFIAKKEARESTYWLELLQSTKLSKTKELDALIDESVQITRILQTITTKVSENIK